MSERWDFYFFDNQGKAASAFIDLGIARDVPLPDYPVSACLYLDMATPRPDGLSSNEEYDALIEVEDTIAELSDQVALYVGRVTSEGRRDFYFYVSDAGRWEADVRQLMERFPRYHYRTASRQDPDWDVYSNHLYPDEEQRHSISNRQVCESLERHGDPLTDARDIDHWTYFPDATIRDEFIRQASAMGYQLRGAWGPDEDNGDYAAQLYRSDVPAFDQIDDATHPLVRLAERLGGRYDGWECMVLKVD